MNGLLPVPVINNAIGGGVRSIDYGRRAFLPGEESCLCKFHGVQGGDGTRVAGSPSTDASWEGNSSETVLRNHGPWRGSVYLYDVLLNHWGAVELPYRGVSGTGSNMDSNAGSFLSPAYPGYRHHIGGGKSTSPTVTPMQHVGALACTELKAPRHHPVRQGGREEASTADRGGSEGE